MSDLGGFTVDGGGLSEADAEAPGESLEERGSDLCVKTGGGALLLTNGLECDDEARWIESLAGKALMSASGSLLLILIAGSLILIGFLNN
jgi:hypothetical protein